MNTNSRGETRYICPPLKCPQIPSASDHFHPSLNAHCQSGPPSLPTPTILVATDPEQHPHQEWSSSSTRRPESGAGSGHQTSKQKLSVLQPCHQINAPVISEVQSISKVTTVISKIIWMVKKFYPHNDPMILRWFDDMNLLNDHIIGGGPLDFAKICPTGRDRSK